MRIRRIIVTYFIPASAKIRGAVELCNNWVGVDYFKEKKFKEKLELGSTPERFPAVRAYDGFMSIRD